MTAADEAVGPVYAALWAELGPGLVAAAGDAVEAQAAVQAALGGTT